ncbi:MAG: MerR family transcriptional regulator [Lachnospiraceae bacterium]|nr:MerR family transcriptional regulator [Lachnospiraceae bacterium]
MRISEVASLTGLNVSNIRFYERKGLLTPVREADSKYRDYTQEDVKRIKQILLYRKMGISVETIYLLLHGQADLPQVLERQRAELKSQIEQLKGAAGLCELVLKEKELPWERLDEYLNYVFEEEQKGHRFAEAEELLEDIAEYTGGQIFHWAPWVVWLFQRPRTAALFSLGLWIAVLFVPGLHLFQVFRGEEMLRIPFFLVYGAIIGICGLGFWRFRRAKREYLEKEGARR